MKWGVIYALPQEGITLGQRHVPIHTPSESQDGHLFIRSGMGEKNASKAAQLLIESGIEALISWGTCAALSENISCGALVMASSINGIKCSAAIAPDQLPQFKQVPFAQTSSPLFTPSQKQSLAVSSKAQAADMESYAVAKVAQEHGIPYLILGAVSDDAYMTLPDYLNHATSVTGELSIPLLLTKALTHPRQWNDFLYMCRGGQKALRSLKHIWPTVAEQLKKA